MLKPFIYRGELYRDDGTTMEYAKRGKHTGWCWTPLKGFAARKIRRAREANESSKSKET